MKGARLLVHLVSATTLFAGGTAVWEMNSYPDFLRGKFSGVSLTRDGRLQLAPKTRTLFSEAPGAVWAMAAAPDGGTWLGTGHRGRVYRVTSSGEATLIWTAEQPEVFAIAVDPRGIVYAATSPDGKIYRIENGKATEYFDPQVKYIWSLAIAPDGTLYAGTGDGGKVYAVKAAGRGEVFYETGQSHITALAFDASGRLLAGTDPNGILYRITAKDKAFVVYDANLPEIRAISLAPDGTIYAAALGGSVAKRATAAQNAVTAPGTTISVTATATSITVNEAQAGAVAPPGVAAAKPAVTAAPLASPLIEIPGVEKAAILRIHPDGIVETLWSSKEENIYDLLPRGGDVYFSTDGQGRLYRFSTDRKVTLVEQTNEGEAVRLLPSRAGILLATSNQGRVYEIGETLRDAGSYESPVQDASSIARWGRLDWRTAPGGGTSGNGAAGAVVFRTRTGNSARPDRTWSDWSAPIPAPAPIVSPNARYVQWKAEFSGSAPALDSVSLAYLPQNNAPIVRTVTVVSQLASAGAAKAPSATPATASYSITVTDTGEAGASSLTGTPTQNLGRSATRQVTVSWLAEDQDSDTLVYALYFRGAGEQQWKTLRRNLSDSSFVLDGDSLADGRYFFRVVASDRPSNSTATARDGELVSNPVLIDNTPPVVIVGRNGTGPGIGIRAQDATSPLRRAEYSLDAGPWVMLDSADGVTDSTEETFPLTLDSLAPGEHLLVVRVFDAAGNAGLGKLLLR